MNKTLLAITTANQLWCTRLCIQSLEYIRNDIDIVIFDDASNDGTVKFCKQKNIKN